MKKSLSILVALVISSAALYGANYNREDVLALVAQYNPAILEKAAADEGYNAVLQGLASAYTAEQTDENFIELVALIRNFDNSLALAAASNRYQDALLLNKMNGMDLTTARATFEKEVTDVLGHIWATTLQVQDLALDTYKQRLKEVKKEESLSKTERLAAQDLLKAKIKNVKREIKNLKKYSGAQLTAAANAYVAQTEQNFELKLEQARLAAEAENLQVASKNKKPVAK